MSNALVEERPQADGAPISGPAASQAAGASEGDYAAPQVGLNSTAAPPPEKAPEKSPAVHHTHRWWLYIIFALVVVAAVVYFGVLPRLKRDKETAAHAAAARSALPVVEVVSVSRGSAVQQLTLPGTVSPTTLAHIYGQAAGFLKARYVDLGDKVHRGQLLGVISSPELDATVVQQRALVQQSKDALNKARTQEHLEQVTYDRVHTLAQHGVLSQQDDDVALAAVAAASEDVHAAENAVDAANGSLQHAIAMASFEQIRSPIDGTVTARNIEVGSLISSTGTGQGIAPTPAPAGSGGPATGGAQGGELFQISDLRDLRMYVEVPEQDALYLGTGPQAKLAFSEMPGEIFSATIIRSSDSLSQQTRSLLLEMKIADPRRRLRPGMYATVQISFDAPTPGILISGDSLITLARGTFVAVVDSNIIHMHQVHVGRDLGTQIYVTSGLENGDAVIVNPTDAVQEGVHVVAKAAPKGQEK